LRQRQSTTSKLKTPGLSPTKMYKPLACPVCGSTNTVYNIPDWENGKLVDAGFLECCDCQYTTGFCDTEDGIRETLKAKERYVLCKLKGPK